jgi:chromate transporter
LAHGSRKMLSVFGRIGLLSFGGPAVQIALMHQELDEKRDWLAEAQFLRALSFCMLLPGPEVTQLATYTG